MRDLEDRTFLWLLVAVSVGFALILWPIYGAVLWATVFAIVFTPLYRRLSRSMRHRRTLAAVATVAIILLMVILPLALIGALLAQEASGVYARIHSGDLDFGRYLRQTFDALPDWASNLLDRVGLMNLGDVQERLSTGLGKAGQFVGAQALNIGQNTFDFLVEFFVMLYLLFFLLRDGDTVARAIRDAIPLRAAQRRALVGKFIVVIRATVKGNVVVAGVQGALGGVIFWILGINAPLLWGIVMAVLSLLPAVGAALVWLPVAIYFLATGSVWQGLVLIAYGVLVIGLVDNVLRPLLVGKDTDLPDWVILIATLGGIAFFGLNGFVVGPVIAALFIAAWDIFTALRSERRRDLAGP